MRPHGFIAGMILVLSGCGSDSSAIPCSDEPCGTGATCSELDGGGHRCECDSIDFARPVDMPDIIDCIFPGTVCIKRDNTKSIYNSIAEASYTGLCDLDMPEPEPTGTLWALKPCAETVADDFGPFVGNKFAMCRPPDIVDVHGCLKLTAAGDALWDIEFTQWCERSGGCFAYSRWHGVADGVACD